jgi:starvation-inducible DNA-binding protein
MLESANDSLTHPSEKEGLSVSNECPVETVAILEELLAQSILLRNLYKIARWQTCYGELCRMHQLFEDHYKGQLHLVDVLIDRVRMLGGTGRVLAGDFLKGTQLSCGVRGHSAPGRWVEELLDAHESVLTTAQLVGATDNRQLGLEYAVGLVVLTSDLQSVSLREQWLHQTLRSRGRTILHKDKWM